VVEKKILKIKKPNLLKLLQQMKKKKQQLMFQINKLAEQIYKLQKPQKIATKLAKILHKQSLAKTIHNATITRIAETQLLI
jgi:hypothetical protein